MRSTGVVAAAMAVTVAGCGGGDQIPLANVPPPKEAPVAPKGKTKVPANLRSPAQLPS